MDTEVAWTKRGTWKGGFPFCGAQLLSALGASTRVAVPAVLLPSSDRTQYYRPVTHSQSQFKLFFLLGNLCQEG